MADETESSPVDIDLGALDDEWVRQPKLYYKYAKRLADAKLAMNETKAGIDVVRAETELKIRSDPTSYNLDKVTEATVAAALGADVEVREAIAQHVNARHDVDILEAMVNALDHKKRALENLVSLQNANYFARPVAKTDNDREAVGEFSKLKARRRAAGGR